jgi:hypothetical protein
VLTLICTAGGEVFLVYCSFLLTLLSDIVSVEVRLFTHAKDFATRFEVKIAYQCEPDGCIRLETLAESLSLSGCFVGTQSLKLVVVTDTVQVIDPDNFCPLYTPDGNLHSHYVSLHLKKQGFIRVIPDV